MSEQTNERESERVPMTTTTTIRMWLCLCVCRSVLALFHSVANSSAANKNDPKLRQSLNMQFVSKLYVALPAHIFNIFVWLLNRHTYTHTHTGTRMKWENHLSSPIGTHKQTARRRHVCVVCMSLCVFSSFLSSLSLSHTRISFFCCLDSIFFLLLLFLL